MSQSPEILSPNQRMPPYFIDCYRKRFDMSSLRYVGGLALLLLATAKVVALVVLLWQGASDRTTEWLVKQVVYAAVFTWVGLGLLRSPDTTGGKE